MHSFPSNRGELSFRAKPSTAIHACEGDNKEQETGEDVAGMIAGCVPGICSAQDMRTYFNYHHSAADTLDKVDRRHLAENAAVTSVVTFALADADEPAPRK